MITAPIIHRFIARARGQALREGTQYAQEARVGAFVGSDAGVSAVVRGRTDDFEVVLWAEGGELAHRCSCPSWRNPCKHEVAAALVLRQTLARKAVEAEQPEAIGAEPLEGGWAPPDPEAARRRAIEERLHAARRERFQVVPEDPPFLLLKSASGFSYRVHLRGGPDGPHGCDCPDFEANRLHTCKHVERARLLLRARRAGLPGSHRKAAARPRVYLHFGEVVEPRLLGRAAGTGSKAVNAAFDRDGLPLRPLARDETELRRRLEAFGPWVEPEALAWLDARIRRRPRLPAADPADLLPATALQPYPYQRAGAAFLAGAGRALLADEMGLGKTIQAILAAAALRRAEFPADHVTIVCPASLRGGWQDEIRRWLGEEAVLLDGSGAARARSIAARPPWLVTHYEQVLRDVAHHRAHPPDLLIIDEAQRAKGLRTRTARVLKAIEARYVFALTGTPLENRLEDAYAIAQLIDQRLLPPLWQIDRDHFVRDPKGSRVNFYRSLDALRARLAPAFLRRRKEDVALQLPERIRSTVMVPMHPDAMDTHEAMMSQVARIAARKVILPADLDRMQRLLVIARRCCDGPHMLGQSVADAAVPKLRELQDALEDLCLGEGRKAVVFSEWTDMTDRVEDVCKRLRLACFHLKGDLPVRRRPALIRAFSEHAGPAAFISTDAGGVGLNLQAADVVVNLDLPWNPAKLEQRIARVHRIGSKSAVQVILLVTKECVEERILALHETKRNVLENIWAAKGEDVIAAPGGSGAFREMVRALIGARPPAPEAAAPSTAVEVIKEEAAASPLPAAAAASAGAPAPAAPPAAAMDPAAIAAAVAAVASALPPDHRASLATVFRALAEALEGAPALSPPGPRAGSLPARVPVGTPAAAAASGLQADA
jgi:superfamily II DNA or RNA helicase